jgi:WD40 repeat protein
VGQLAGHEALVNAVAFSPDGKHVASGSGIPAPGRLTPFDHGNSAAGTDNSLRIWDVERRAKVHQINSPAPVSAISFSISGKLVIAASGNNVQMIDVATGTSVTAIPPGERFAAGLSTADRKFSLRHAIGSSVLIESQTGQEVRKLAGPIDGLPLHHAFSQDGSRVVLGTGKAELFKRNPEAPGSVYVFEVSSGKRLAHLVGHRREVTGVAITADGQYAFSRDGEKRLLLWELAK